MTSYLLYINDGVEGTFTVEQIKELCRQGRVPVTAKLAAKTRFSYDAPVLITSLSDFSDVSEHLVSVASPASESVSAVPAPTRPSVEQSGVATALTIIAFLELISAPIAGFGIGSNNAFVGWMVFVSGVISGLIFPGFARVIQHTFESSQRLRRIEMLIERRYDDKNAA